MKPRHLANPLGIRGKVLLLGVLPLVVMTLLLGYHLIDIRLEHNRSVLVERGSLMVRQLALVSEFGLFSHDQEMLATVVDGVVFDKDVLWAAVLDHDKEVVARGGLVSEEELQAAFTPAGLERHSPALFLLPVGVLGPPLPNIGSEPQTEGEGDEQWPLGWAVVRLSLEGSLERREDILLGSLVLIGGGLLFTVLMGLWVGRSITRPVMNLSESVDNLRRGELSARVEARSSGELGHLETGFNEMAYALQEAQEHLEQQVDTATAELQETVATLQHNNQALQTAQQEALQAGREKQAFLARMSHEIRTPLNAVIGFSHLLKGRPDAEETREYIRTIDLAARQLLYLVDDILQFTRLESENIELESVEYNLSDCLEDVVILLSSAAHDKGLELSLLLHSDLPARVVGDPNRVSQVVTNLLNNAIKFTDSGHVFVEAGYRKTRGQPEVHIRVSDSGIGLTPDEKERLFKAFSQADSSVTRRFGGSGLGLAISKHLVSLMGGTIGVESEKSTGSVFHFTIPCPIASHGTREESVHVLAGRRILLYDRQPLTRRTLRATLLQWQMTVFNSGDFGQVLELLETDADQDPPYDLVLLGLDPRESDSEHFPALFSRLRHRYRGPALILVGREQWRPPPPADLCPRISWGVKPARRSTLEQRICELLQIEFSRPDPAPEAPVDMLSFAGLHILSAEDNEFNRLLLRRLLEERGATMQDACSGQEAVDMARQESFDLILMDIHMPGLDGIEAAWRIREQLGRSTPPIIALTADLFVTAAEETQSTPFDDHLTKPVIAEALEAALARWTAGDPGSDDVTTEPNRDSPGRGRQSVAEATGHPPLPQDLEEQLYSEVLRLHAELERLRDQPTGQEFQDFAHQLAGLAGLYGLEELATRARKLEQAARSNLPKSVAPELQQLGVLVAALPAPAKSDS